MITGRDELDEFIVRALAIELKVPEEAIRQAGSLRRDLKMDSIAAVNVAFMIEEELELEIDLREDDAFDSIGEIVAIVERSMA